MYMCLDYRYATEVDVDFVRKSVRAIGRCAIKVEPAAERCVSTLLDLIQTKVNYVVQEAIVVIKVHAFSDQTSLGTEWCSGYFSARHSNSPLYWF